MATYLGGLQKYTKEEKQKFTEDRLLFKSVNDYYPDKFLIQYHKFDEPKEFDLWDAIKGEKVDLGNRKIVFGIKAKPEEFTQYDFLWCPDGPAFVVHKRVLDKFNELCPNDIQALPMILKNLDPKGEQFEDREFRLINVLSIKDVIDREKSGVYYENITDGAISQVPMRRGDMIQFRNRMCLKGIDSLEGSLIARVKEYTSHIVFDPSLARHFINSRGVQFLTDEEKPK